MEPIEVDTKAGTKLTMLACDIRGIESKPDGCSVQWLIGDVLAKVDCTTRYEVAVALWRGRGVV